MIRQPYECQLNSYSANPLFFIIRTALLSRINYVYVYTHILKDSNVWKKKNPLQMFDCHSDKMTMDITYCRM
jgi:hypothetical protein